MKQDHRGPRCCILWSCPLQDRQASRRRHVNRSPVCMYLLPCQGGLKHIAFVFAFSIRFIFFLAQIDSAISSDEVDAFYVSKNVDPEARYSLFNFFVY